MLSFLCQLLYYVGVNLFHLIGLVLLCNSQNVQIQIKTFYETFRKYHPWSQCIFFYIMLTGFIGENSSDIILCYYGPFGLSRFLPSLSILSPPVCFLSFLFIISMAMSSSPRHTCRFINHGNFWKIVCQEQDLDNW